MLEKEIIVLGIDIGGTFTKLGLVSSNGKVLHSTSFRTKAQSSFRFFAHQLKIEGDLLINQLKPHQQLVSIGIGAPNANPLSGQMEHPPNFKWGTFVPITETINHLFSLPVVITNDANAAALGELNFGLAKGMKNFIVLTLGTGLGSGIIVNGQLLQGSHGLAGELGHMSAIPNGRACNCGLYGCLETYASATGIKKTVFQLMAECKEDSPLRGVSYDELIGEIIADAALHKDTIACKAFKFTGKILGEKIADMATFLDPEAIILTGGLTKAGDILLKPTHKAMEENLFIAYKNKIKILLSPSTGLNGVIGAAALAFQKRKVPQAV